jgi:hypothetical protein
MVLQGKKVLMPFPTQRVTVVRVAVVAQDDGLVTYLVHLYKLQPNEVWIDRSAEKFQE